MKWLLSISYLCLTCFFLIDQKNAFAIEDIHDFHWQKRIILIHAVDKTKIISQLAEVDNEILDRHIYWFVFTPDEVISNYPGKVGNDFTTKTITTYFPGKRSGVVLIGKDGGIKRRADTLQLQELFSLIDTMPMRKREMGRY